MPKRKQHGAGVLDVLKKIGSVVKENQLISKGLSMIPDSRAQTASAIAAQLGLGRRPRRRRQTGRGIFSDLGGGIGSVFGGLGSGLGSFSHGLFGSGKRRRPRRRLMI